MNARGGRIDRSGIAAALIAAMFVLAGCQQEKAPPPPRDALRPAPTESTGSRTEIFPFGRIPFDNATIPLIHPDGTLIATQTGLPQTPAVRFAEQSAPPVGAAVAVFRPVAKGSGPGERPALEPVFVLAEAVLLGRSSNQEGFIVEAPRADGSRDIGLASWETGNIRWLVEDGRVNAFASLGAGGRLAWCRSRPGDGHFEIVVSGGDITWTLGDLASSWLMPTWAASGEGLFALRLSDDGTLEALYLHGTDEATMHAANRAIRLSNQGDFRTAVGMLAAQPSIVGVPAPVQPVFVFQHPEYNAVAVWRPFRSDSGATKRLQRGSTAAAIDSSGLALATAAGGVYSENLDDTAPPVRVLEDVALPMVTSSTAWKYLLFAPTGPGTGEMFVVGMKLVEGR